MKVLFALISVLVFSAFTPAFAETPSIAQLCRQALAEYKNKDLDDADLSILQANDVATKTGVPLPTWCQKHYRQIRLGGLTASLNKFERGYAIKDWNAAFIRIPLIDTTVRELGVTLPDSYWEKRIVVSARNEELRKRIMALPHVVIYIQDDPK